MGVELESYHFVTRNYSGMVGGGCTKAAWEAHPSFDYWMGANGEPILTVSDGLTTNGDYYDPDEGFYKFDLIKAGAFVNVPVGVVCYLRANGGGAFFVVISNPDDDTIWLRGSIESLEAYPNAVYLGGAYNSLVTALSSQNVKDQDAHQTIFTNKNENLTSTLTVLKANAAYLLTIEGFYATPGDGGVITLDCQGNSIHAMDIVSTMTAQINNITVQNTGKPAGYCGFYIRKNTGQCFGIVFNNCKATGFDNGFCTQDSNVNNIRFANCEAYGNNNGFYLQGRNEVVDRCISHDNTQKGIYSVSTIISNSLLFGNDTGIYFDDGSGMILNCTLYNNSSYGIYLYYAGIIVMIYNTIISSSGIKNLYAPNGGLLVGDYNCFFDGGGTDSGHIAGPHDLDINPQFVDASGGDFRPLNPEVLRGGQPDIQNNKSQQGAILQQYQFYNRNRVVNFSRLAILR